MQPYNVYLWAGPVLALSWLSLAIINPGSNIMETVVIGYFLGSLFAHPTLAAAWAAFGPGPAIWRIPLSIVWVLTLPIAIAWNVSLHGGPAEAALILGACFLGQWACLQVPLWGIALGFKVGLNYRTGSEPDGQKADYRFGIRHLLIVMAITSVVLGIGRVVVPRLQIPGQGETQIFIFLVVAAILVTLPLLLATLMRRFAVVGIVLALVLVVVGTIWEFPLFQSIGGNGPGTADFIAINTFSASLILLVAGIVRLNGYSLYMHRSPSSQ